MNKKFYYAMAQSDDIDPEDAANEIAEKCLAQLNGRKPDAGILYMGIAVDHQKVLDIICSRIGDIELIGCTTDGEFSSETGYLQDSVLLMLFCSNEVEFVSGKIDLNRYDIVNIKKEIKLSLDKIQHDPRIGILFSDGITLNSENSLEIMNNVFNDKVPFFGGAAADKYRFTGTKQFYNNTVLESTAVYLLICGNFDFSFALGTGWDPVGQFGIVNSSDKNIIKEINNIPAMEFYRQLIGEEASLSDDMPMAVYDENDSFMYLRTTLVNSVRMDGALTFLGNIPENFKVRLTLVDRNSILDGVVSAVKNAKKMFPPEKKPSVAICFSCSSRRAILGLRTDEECRIVQSKLGQDVIVFGFYTYGEFSPPGISKKTVFHNESFVCLLLE